MVLLGVSIVMVLSSRHDVTIIYWAWPTVLVSEL